MSKATIKQFRFKRNDTKPYLEFTLEEPDPDNPGQYKAVDVSGSVINFTMVNATTLAVKATGACVITDGPNGKFEYQWSGTDTDTAGDYLGEAEIIYSLGGKETFPKDNSLEIKIIDDFNAS